MKSFILLCGGKSRRMGQDKGSMNLNGKPMIIHVIKNLISVADEVVVVLRDKNQVEDYSKIFEDLNSIYSQILLRIKDLLQVF